MNIDMFLLMFAFVLFIIAGIGVAIPPRFNLMAIGLALYILTLII